MGDRSHPGNGRRRPYMCSRSVACGDDGLDVDKSAAGHRVFNAVGEIGFLACRNIGSVVERLVLYRVVIADLAVLSVLINVVFLTRQGWGRVGMKCKTS